MDNFITYLNENIVSLTENEVKTIIDAGRTETLQKGDIFIGYGKRTDKIAFILSGILEMSIIINDNERIIDFFYPSSCAMDFFSYSMDSPSESQIVAIQKSSILVFEKDTLKKLFNENEAYKRIEQFILEKSNQEILRRIRWMYLSPKERYETLQENYPGIIQQVPQYKIASFLNVTPEWLSKIRATK